MKFDCLELRVSNFEYLVHAVVLNHIALQANYYKSKFNIYLYAVT